MFSRIPRAGLSTFAFFLLATVAGRGVDIISQDKFYGGNGSVALPSPQVAIQGNGNLITSGDTGTQAKGRYEMRDHVAIPGLHPFRLHDRHTTGTRTLALEWSTPFHPPSGPGRRLFQEPPAKSNFILQLSRNGIKRLDLQPVHCVAVSTLPWHHRDPFGRLLTAQALCEKRRLVSCDPVFDAYGVQRVW